MRSQCSPSLAPAVGGLLLAASPAAAKTIVVDDPATPDCKKVDSPTIQGGVNLAGPKDKVQVCPGVYTEQVTIPASKNGLKLDSQKPRQATIKAPPVMVDKKAIVWVRGARDVDITQFVIAGPGGGGCDSIRFGVLVDASGEARIADNEIRDIRDNPFSGCQNGNAIEFGTFNGGSPEPGFGTAEHNFIHDYQKTGVVTNEEGSVSTVRQNTIVGIGPTPAIAQNGIQVGFGAVSHVDHNDVTDNNYTQPDATSAGILLQEAGASDIDHNTALRNNIGIDLVTVTDQEIDHNVTNDNSQDGILAESDTSDNTIEHNKAAGNGEFDCRDDSAGTGTAGTANFWLHNDGVTENRPGICTAP